MLRPTGLPVQALATVARRCDTLAMRFEHLIQITDPADARVPPMSREELWRGLMKRVETPQFFDLGPDRCEIEPADFEAPDRRRRALAYGRLAFRDTVRLDAGCGLHFVPEPHDEQPPVELRIRIEEPQAGTLLLRFVYSSAAEPAPGEAGLWRLREQAWLEQDRDMVRTLREWQAGGLL
jgi:hypothetical protein